MDEGAAQAISLPVPPRDDAQWQPQRELAGESALSPATRLAPHLQSLLRPTPPRVPVAVQVELVFVGRVGLLEAELGLQALVDRSYGTL